MKPLKPDYDSQAVQADLVHAVCSFFGRVFDEFEVERHLALRGHRPGDEKWLELMTDDEGEVMIHMNQLWQSMYGMQFKKDWRGKTLPVKQESIGKSILIYFMEKCFVRNVGGYIQDIQQGEKIAFTKSGSVMGGSKRLAVIIDTSGKRNFSKK